MLNKWDGGAKPWEVTDKEKGGNSASAPGADLRGGRGTKHMTQGFLLRGALPQSTPRSTPKKPSTPQSTLQSTPGTQEHFPEHPPEHPSTPKSTQKALKKALFSLKKHFFEHFLGRGGGGGDPQKALTQKNLDPRSASPAPTPPQKAPDQTPPQTIQKRRAPTEKKKPEGRQRGGGPGTN